jgi:hypothetical protein
MRGLRELCTAPGCTRLQILGLSLSLAERVRCSLCSRRQCPSGRSQHLAAQRDRLIQGWLPNPVPSIRTAAAQSRPRLGLIICIQIRVAGPNKMGPTRWTRQSVADIQAGPAAPGVRLSLAFSEAEANYFLASSKANPGSAEPNAASRAGLDEWSNLAAQYRAHQLVEG